VYLSYLGVTEIDSPSYSIPPLNHDP